MRQKIVVIGGGAAGFFGAIACAEAQPDWTVILLERGPDVLEKVRISGGGRCNVTHAEFVNREFVKNYPRGQREMPGPLSRFAAGDAMEWFQSRAVPLKIEPDGRVFPVSNSSSDIVNCLVTAAKNAGVEIITRTRVTGITKTEDLWQIETSEQIFEAHKILIATGSNTPVWDMLAQLGHTVVPAVPSLFTFQIEDALLTDLAGISLPLVTVSIPATKQHITDNFLITHRGISGFSVLKLSALAARELHALNYKTTVQLNFLPGENMETVFSSLLEMKAELNTKQLHNCKFPELPQRLWQRLLQLSDISVFSRWTDISNKDLRALATRMVASQLQVTGKDTHKEEFVTAGGVKLKELDFKRFESKVIPSLFLAGEVLDIDALTGGFNFQAAWTGGYLAGLAMAETLPNN